MPIAALLTWVMTAAGGLYLLTIWLIEYDREFQSVAATRLPVPVISSHALLAVTGLVLWAIYLITDVPGLDWVVAAILGVVVILGLAHGGALDRRVPHVRVEVAPGARLSPGTGRRGCRRLRCGPGQPDGHSARTPFPGVSRHPARGVRDGHRRPGAADRADQELTALMKS